MVEPLQCPRLFETSVLVNARVWVRLAVSECGPCQVGLDFFILYSMHEQHCVI